MSIPGRSHSASGDHSFTPEKPDFSECPRCGEWRDSPTADCAECGYSGLCRCGHDHLDPPWREGDENTCNATMGALICGCRTFTPSGVTPEKPA